MNVNQAAALPAPRSLVANFPMPSVSMPQGALTGNDPFGRDSYELRCVYNQQQNNSGVARKLLKMMADLNKWD